MKYSILFLTILLFSCSTGKEKTEQHENHSDHSVENDQQVSKSPLQMAMTNVGKNHVHIEYYSPSKRGRQIFGGLVAYGEVWVTGAHNATSIRFSKDVQIGGVKVPEGKYALFTIPGETEWTVIINKNWEQHLADEYNEEEDLVRLRVKPRILDEPVESLTYEVITKGEETGNILISWDDVEITFEVINY